MFVFKNMVITTINFEDRTHFSVTLRGAFIILNVKYVYIKIIHNNNSINDTLWKKLSLSSTPIDNIYIIKYNIIILSCSP